MVIGATPPLELPFDAGKVLEKLSVFRPWVVYVFGSASTGRMRADSDIDLAFLPEITSSPVEVFEVANALAELLGREVDLVDLSRASTVMCKEVMRTGTVISEVRPDKRQWFEMKTLSDYARLNEQRAPVLEKIKKGIR